MIVEACKEFACTAPAAVPSAGGLGQLLAIALVVSIVANLALLARILG